MGEDVETTVNVTEASEQEANPSEATYKSISQLNALVCVSVGAEDLEGEYVAWVLVWLKTTSRSFGEDWVRPSGSFFNEQIHVYESEDTLFILNAYNDAGFFVTLSDGSPKFSSLLTSDFIEGNDYVDVADPTKFHEGDIVVLNSDINAGANARIKAISGNRLTLHAAITYSGDYLMSDNAFAVAWIDTVSAGWDTDTALSLSRYYACVRLHGASGSDLFLDIFKDGVLTQSTNVSAIADVGTWVELAISKSGKYVLLGGTGNPDNFMLFQGI